MTTAVLQEPTLVLNRVWIPIRVATVQEALTLVCKGAARVVRPETYETFDFDSWASLGAARHEAHVRTVHLRVPVPEVVVLSRYGGTPTREIVFSRRNLFRRDRHTCQYCGARPGFADLTLDHVLPRSRGGRSTWENVVVACLECNKRKANRTPAGAGMRLRRRPRQPRWSPRLAVAVAHRRESWEAFVSRAYWNAPLEP